MMLLKACIMILSADARETDDRNKFYDLNGVCDSGIGGAADVHQQILGQLYWRF